MAKKKYIAKSHISLSVRLTDKVNAHITFSPLTGGGSVLYTDDEKLQEALEKHHKFGKLFKEDKTFVEQTSPKKSNTPTPVKVEPQPMDNEAKNEDEENGDAPSQQVEDNTDDSTDDGAVKKINITCLDDAKEYLSDKFGISRTKLRSKKAIEEAAAENGIEFVGI